MRQEVSIEDKVLVKAAETPIFSISVPVRFIYIIACGRSKRLAPFS